MWGQWSSFTILKAAEHGKQVKQGELLIAFDPEKIDQAIDDLRTQLKLADISPPIFEVFKITRLNKLFDISNDTEHALSSYRDS